jgi:hypothetical protein
MTVRIHNRLNGNVGTNIIKNERGILLNKRIQQLKTVFEDRSLDSEYYLAFIYLATPLLAMLITLTSTFFLSKISNRYVFILMLAIAVIPNAFLVYFLGKRMLNYFKEKRLMLGIISLYIVVLFLAQTTSWLFFFLSHVSNLLAVASNLDPQNVEFYPGKLVFSLVEEVYPNISENWQVICPIMGISFAINPFLPSSLQRIDISIKDKMKRFIIKIAYVSFISVAIYAFYKMSRDHIVIVSALYGAIMTLGSPEKILSILNPKNNYSTQDISDETKKSFLFFKYFLTYLYVAWIFPVALYSSDFEKRSFLFFAILFGCLIVTISLQIYAQTTGKDFFNLWIKEENRKEIDKETK